MKQLEIIAVLETLQKNFRDDYISHSEEKLYGRRTRNIHKNIVEISKAMQKFPKDLPGRIAKYIFFEAMQKDYWYKFLKAWD